MKPMLAGKCTDPSKILFPVLVSPKMDGVRALVIDGQLMSRSLKPIPNLFAQQRFSNLPDGTDGELIVGQPYQDPYRRTVSTVMSDDGVNAELQYFIFDNFKVKGGFEQRFRSLNVVMKHNVNVFVVLHPVAENLEQLLEYERQYVKLGYEGAMIRSINGPYKFGRSTEKEGYLLKLKRFEDSEAVVLDAYERMHNENEAGEDELGHTERSTKKEGMVPAGDLGGFNVRDVKTGVEFSVGGGYTAAERVEFWKFRKRLIGQTLVYKYFPTGSKDRPRFPVYKGWRSPIDL
jgi:DNA ligase-1